MLPELQFEVFPGSLLKTVRPWSHGKKIKKVGKLGFFRYLFSMLGFLYPTN